MRLLRVDALKALASQLIVLHHLAFYGPMPEAAAGIVPELIDWLAEHARIAVQVFLVVGGFLAARALDLPGGPRLDVARICSALARRYMRLVLPLAAAIALAIVAAALARIGMNDDATPAAPTFAQVIAHLALAQDLIGLDALSAGVWYVAIDFQLFALTLVAAWLGQRIGMLWLPIVGLAMASSFGFNRVPQWDLAAPYFYAAYALGIMAWCARHRTQHALPVLLTFAATVVALIVAFRLRLAVALCVAIVLAVSMRCGQPGTPRPAARLLTWFGDISYSLFLVHFPVLLVVNAAFARYVGADAWANLLGLGLAWLASLAAGALFHRHVERRLAGERRPVQAVTRAAG
jgi:peptidoglycan/LPS O-acetylase OafA/YrhL